MWLNLISLMLSKAAPLLLGCLGGLLSEQSGVINFALEGMMLLGAFGAVWATYVSGSPWVGLIGGAAGGMLIGLLHAFISLKLRANQIVSSIALNLMASGLTGMLLNQVFEVYGTSPSVASLPSVQELIVPLFPSIQTYTESFPSRLSVLVPLALMLWALTMGFFKWSVWGLRIRACGENPEAARAAGLNVTRIRFLAVLFGGSLAGLGGAYLSIGELSQFVEHMTQGRGYLAIAALILGRWSPQGVLAATLFFGLNEALSEWMAVRWSQLPHEAFLAFPYIISFMALIFHFGKRQPPSALGRL
jgi:general nucleoside transport system permease protein